PAPRVLDEIVVTATRGEERAFEVPASLTRIGWEEIQVDRMRRTLPDALLDTPSVMVQRTAHGQASPFLRGFTGYQTLILVDGIRLNNSTFRSGPNQYFSTIDSFSVEALEVVRGPSSVLHGSDAAGGVFNALPRRARFEEEQGARFRAGVRWSSAEESFTERAELEARDRSLSVAAGVTLRDYGDLRAGRGTGEQPETGYAEDDQDFRAELAASSTALWTLGFQRVHQDDVPRTEQTVHSIPFEGTDAGTELRRDLTQDRSLVYLRFEQSDAGLPFADRVRATLSWHDQRESQERQRTGGRFDRQKVDVDTLGLQVEGSRATAAGLLTGGVEWWRDDVSSGRTNYRDGVVTGAEVQGPVGDDAGYDLAGIFLQDAIPLGKATLTAGARFTWAAARADRVDDTSVPGTDPDTPGNVASIRDSWTDLSGSLRAVVPVAERANLFGGLSQAFRAPNLSDLTRLDDTSGFETPSLDLDPEEFLAAEIGVRAEDDRGWVQAALWRTWIDGLIVASPTGNLVGTTPEVRKDNVGDGWVHGFEMEGGLRPHRDWEAVLGFTWMDGEVDQYEPSGRKVTAPLSRLMPMTVAATVRWEPRGRPWSAWVSGRWAARQDDLSLKDETDTRRIPPGGTPGYVVASLGGSWEVTEAVTASLALENLFDENYRIHGSGVNEPGRSLVLWLEARF
ncbi:MAG: TonB-dependent receptor, partial [Planctomycetaceae bacterium]|nr:TonB-dependent receptor [Planctomycetaceae bacterium]